MVRSLAFIPQVKGSHWRGTSREGGGMDLHFTKLTWAAVWGITWKELKSGNNEPNYENVMEKEGLNLAGGDRGGEKELECGHIFAVRADIIQVCIYGLREGSRPNHLGLG